MNKTIFSIIIALGFNAFALGVQSPLKGSVSAQAAKPTFRMAQINQWNNMLPYAFGTGALGLATAAGVSYSYYNKYDNEHAKLERELKMKKDAGEKAMQEVCEPYFRGDEQVLEQLAVQIENIGMGNRQENVVKFKETISKVRDCSHRTKLGVDWDLLGRILNDNESVRNFIRNYKSTLQYVRKEKRDQTNPYYKKIGEADEFEQQNEARVASLARKKSLVKWIGISTGISAVGLTGLGIYKWFWPSTSKK